MRATTSVRVLAPLLIAMLAPCLSTGASTAIRVETQNLLVSVDASRLPLVGGSSKARRCG